jgi:hypothetical protein
VTRRRLSLVLAAIFIGIAINATAAVTGSAAATPGTWGADESSYLDGIVCPTADGSSPLAAWDFGTGSAAYLVVPVTSTGSTDSAALPFTSAGRQSVTTVGAGRDGFTSVTDIATYARLLSRSLSTQDTAQVAEAVMAKAGASNGPACGGTSDIASLVNSAANQAGPYTVTVTPATTPTVMGQPDIFIATVRSATGNPVPQLTVAFTSPDASLAATTATTDGTGAASIRFTAPTGTTAPSVSVTASVSASIGLDEVSILANPSPTVPSGASVSAIYPAPPVTVTATANVTIDPSAQPLISTKASVNAIDIGSTFSPTATVSGLRGHTGNVNFTVYGPLPNTGDCAQATFSPSSPIAGTTSTVQTSGDATVTALPWKPTRPGCYSVQANVATTNASPNGTASSNFQSGDANVLVLATTASLSLAHPIAGVGPIAADIHIAHSDSASGVVSGRVLGPVAPDGGSCAKLDWTKAPHTIGIANTPINGDAPITLKSAPANAVGCYLIQPTLDLTVPDFGTVEVPVTTSAPATVLLLAPTVTETTDQIWSISPARVKTHVSTAGTMGQPAHVAIQMMYVPSSVFGCRTVDWHGAVLATTGPAVAVPATNVSMAVLSGATPKPGCYAPVPRLTMDANPAVTAVGPLGIANDIIGAGIDANAKATRPLDATLTASSSSIYTAGELFAVLLGAAIAATITLARYDTT